MSVRHALVISLCCLGLFAATPTHAVTVLVDENFNHPDGSLVGQVPTPGPGGVWLNHSGTLGDLLVSSGVAVVQHGVPSEDAHTEFAPVTDNGIYATFDASVSDDSKIAGDDFEYFAHFSDGGSFNFYGRVDVVPPNDPNSGDFTLGISTASGTAEAILPTDYNFGDVLRVTVKYNFVSGLARLTVGGDSVSSTGVVVAPGIAAFNLRQSDSSNNETVFVDNLLVQYVPEPASFGLMLLGLVGMVSRRHI